MMAISAKPKPKRRNSEKRKEKSRDAARSRRSKETEIFCQLAHELPVNFNLLSQLDKASIIRLIITHLKLRGIFQHVIADTAPTTFPKSSDLERRLDQLYYKALGGFLMVITSNGDLIYISDNVVSHLGVTQLDMLGQSIFEFIHPCDHDEIRDVCCSKQNFVDGVGQERDFFVRMKSTLTSKGRSINIKSASYRVVHCSGHLMPSDRSSEPLDLTKNDSADVSYIVLNGCPIQHPSSVEMPIDNRSFVSRHSMDMKFVDCDEGISAILGFRSDELIGTCMYEYHHALDGDSMEKAYKTLFAKGQSVTGLYRFLAKNGGYAWVETQATVVKNPRTEKAQFVICVNSVVSGILNENEMLCTIQQSSILKRENDEQAAEIIVEEEGIDIEEEEEDQCDEDQIQFVTEKFLHNLGTRSSYVDDAIPCHSTAGHRESIPVCIQPDNTDIMERSKVADRTITPVSSSESLYKMIGDVMGDEYELRAPYISMDDMFFGPTTTTTTAATTTTMTSQENDPTVSCTIDTDSQMLVVSGQLNPEVITTFYTVSSGSYHNNQETGEIIKFNKRPVEVIGMPAASVIGVVPSKVARYQLDRNNLHSTATAQDHEYQLENKIGYPQPKPVKPVCKEPIVGGFGSSVLRNLLLNGEDVNFGYRLNNGGTPGDQPISTMPQTTASQAVPYASTLYRLLCSQSDAVIPADNLLRIQNDSVIRLCQQQKSGVEFGH